MTQESNASESPQTDAANEIIHKQAFGVLLREAREKQNYTVVEVAESLRLSEAHIHALENSRIDELPGKTFTLGYIRSYTRMLNMDDQLVIDTYLEYYDEEEPPLQHTGKSAVVDSGNKTVLVAVALVAAVLIGIFVFWPQSQVVDDIPSSPALEKETAPAAGEVKDKAPLPVAAKEEPSAQSQSAPAVVSKKTVTEETGDELVKQGTSSSVNEDLLQIHVSDESWAKIEDAGGQRLFYAMLKPGENYQFNGQSPFKIFLGNAPAVQLSVNHQDVDLKGHIKSNNVAQITVDETASIQ